MSRASVFCSLLQLTSQAPDKNTTKFYGKPLDLTRAPSETRRRRRRPKKARKKAHFQASWPKNVRADVIRRAPTPRKLAEPSDALPTPRRLLHHLRTPAAATADRASTPGAKSKQSTVCELSEAKHACYIER